MLILPYYVEFFPEYATFSFYTGETDRIMDFDFHYSLFNFSGSSQNDDSVYVSFGQRFSLYEEDAASAAFFASRTKMFCITLFGSGLSGAGRKQNETAEYTYYSY